MLLSPLAAISATSDVVAFDPGKTTGYASLYGEKSHLSTGNFEKWSEVGSRIHPHSVVIVERPFLTHKTDPVVFCVYGVVQYVSEKAGAEIIIQEASVPEYISARIPEVRGIIRIGIHRYDALCHILYYLHQFHKIPVPELLDAVRQGHPEDSIP